MSDKAKKTRGSNDDRGVFMISIAAELSGMHPQTLRIYEQRGLIKPKRSAKQTRLYSQRDVNKLRQIQELTQEFGMNLAGVGKVFELEEIITEMEAQLDEARQRLEKMRWQLAEEIEKVHRSYRNEIVVYDPKPSEVVPARQAKSFRIPVKKKGRK